MIGELARWVLLLAAVILLLPCAVVCLQVCAALWSGRMEQVPVGLRPRIAVLMPAHNEAAVIGASLRSIVPQLASQDRLLVVADNCDDDTALIAAGAGAEVAVRCDDLRRGKGYALDFGLRRLERDPPDVVVVVDADCQVAPDALGRLAAHCHATRQPVQALYAMDGVATGPGGHAGVHVPAFAWRVKNLVRPLGMARLGLPCQLMGTGMAFPWCLVGRLDLAHGGLVEDMQLGVDLAASGAPPRFLPEAQVSSVFPANAAALATQRARWEHGHLSMICYGVPRLLFASARRGDLRPLALALDLAVPPLALLAFAAVLLTTVGTAFAYATGDTVLHLVANLPLLLLSLAIAAAWRRWGRDLLPPAALLGIPRYVWAKLPLYLRFLSRRETRWVKTGRD